MDNHPIPQDVTGFQFKLIGNMTVKQFGYVICGVIIAGLIYALPTQSTLGILIKTILIPLIGSSGLIIAFLPIEGRPVDVMAGNFIKALFSPNQFVYHKTGRLFSFATVPTSKVQEGKIHAEIKTKTQGDKGSQLTKILQSSHIQKQTVLDQKEATFLQSLASFAPAPALQSTQQSTPPQQITPMQQPIPTRDSLAKEEELLNQQLQQAKKEEVQNVQQARGATSEAHQKALSLERQVQTLHFQRQQLEEQLAHLQKQLASQKTEVQQPVTTVAATQAPSQPSSPIQPVISQPAAILPAQELMKEASKKIGLPHTPDTPNVIAGVVKDPRGNVLPNILVEVKDKEGNPVRAFKTNALGQFASATPLTSGNYTVELEDPKKQNTFSIIQLAATNQIFLPIEIISHDAREELRKQLFN